MSEMMPWRRQAAILWLAVRYVLWPPDSPLWCQFVYKAGQVAAIAGWYFRVSWMLAAGFVLAVAVGWFTADWRGGAR